jgi:hypothetical protein
MTVIQEVQDIFQGKEEQVSFANGPFVTLAVIDGRFRKGLEVQLKKRN